MDSALRLPVLVGGQRVTVDDCAEVERISQAGGEEIALPRIDAETLDQALRDSVNAADELRRMSIDDITIFFDEVGSAWRSPNCEWRKLVIDRGPSITGYPRAFIEWDVGLIGVVLTRGEQYDFLETDLGDPTMLDEWERSKAVYRRYLPKGLIAHIMVGNVPMASLFTLYRSLVTKNLTVAKVPSRDPLTSLAFANCVHDVDPHHPITRALSALYWQPESDIENLVLETADVVSVWGQARSVESIKQRVPCGTDVIEFGPKRSVGLVFDSSTDADRVATKMTFDIMSYEQEGCFSMQETFVVGDPGPLVAALTRALEGASTKFARQRENPDVDAHVQRSRLEAEADGWTVHSAAGTDWTVIVTDGPCQIESHPLSRTIYVHPMQNWQEILPLVDRNVQTVALAPWDQLWDVADELSAAGADRIVQIGHMARFRSGFIHDGFYPMQRMVRLAAVERGRDFKYRFMTMTEEEDEQAVYFQNLREFPYVSDEQVLAEA